MCAKLGELLKNAKYPFLRDSLEYVKDQNIAPDDIVSGRAFERARMLGKQRLLEAVEGAEIKEHSLADEVDCFTEILSYPVARILTSLIKDSGLTKRYALAEAVLMNKRLRGEGLEFVIEVARELGLDVSIDERKEATVERGQNIRLNFADFLRYTTQFRSPEWKLVNQELERGYVLLSKEKLIRILQQALQNKIEGELPLPVEDEIKEKFLKTASEIKTLWESKRKVYKAEDMGKLRITNLPPCIRLILAKSQAGENVPHQARFALTAFLHTVGLSSDEIIKVFAQCPDFDESKSRYQIEHISGKISGTEYTPPECSTMKTYGICNDELTDSLCKMEWLKHPLTYYRVKSGRGRKEMQKGRETEKKNEDVGKEREKT